MITTRTVFDQYNQGSFWKNQIAWELNMLLTLAADRHPDYQKPLLSIVRRVAEFEEIKIQEQLQPLNPKPNDRNKRKSKQSKHTSPARKPKL